MTNSKTLTKKLLATLLVVALIASVGMVFIGTTASSNNMSATSALTTNMADTRAYQADYTLDSKLDGDKQIAGNEPKFGEADWNGRIQVKLHISGVSYVYVNVDPRNMGLFKDDLIVEYRSYYLDGDTEINQKLSNFNFQVTFYEGAIKKGHHNVSKENDSQVGFTYAATSTKINGVEVVVNIKATSGNTRTARFYFGTMYDNCK